MAWLNSDVAVRFSVLAATQDADDNLRCIRSSPPPAHYSNTVIRLR